MSGDADTLRQLLTSIDGRGYGSYKQLKGTYDLGPCRLIVDHVQVDPFAPPSLMRLVLDRATADLPDDLVSDRRGRVATTDYLARAVAAAAHSIEGVSIGAPQQEVLERTSVALTDDGVEARLSVQLPASGRRVRGRQATRLLTEDLPRIAEAALIHASLDADALRAHVTLHRDQEALRDQLAERGLVAFVGDGAILPRRSGDSDLPLQQGAVPFRSPESLQVSFDLPSGARVAGMGVPDGITVIVGGGYHGKSTLLRAIERGVYPHRLSDGREWVITRGDVASVRAEDGRSVAGVDISPFITGLPSGTDTRSFSTTNASGSTSQAATLVEAVDAGASALLIDEDTSATNFMIRDERMRRLIPAEREPITPFVDRIRPLHTERGVSTVLVAGGSGAFFDVADHVIALDEYVPHDVTEQARALADDATPLPDEPVFGPSQARVPATGSLRPTGKTKPATGRGRETIRFGRENIDLAAVSQLVDAAQTQAIAHALDRLAELLDPAGSGEGERTGPADAGRTIDSAVQELFARIDADGLDALSPHRGHPGHLARPRPLEVHAAVNRYRGLRLDER
ncbi:MAG: ABC-ATPase domain-containing protein [Brachybacterium sp.]|uniref:ABC-ATPase domain-containing protein n=1 Tax=Brachybacterium sp. TaxID=1891286 RepID=UPI002648EB94|nr:ABC-ATPase domain-containing protein [Brachybacterium sp.]MDN5687881.1 ABC-ATPase domain-containing protein [Brachybacterium sp.]